MLLTHRFLLTLILAVTGASFASGQAWQTDRWHQLTGESPFFNEDKPELNGAGIIQSDGRFALLILQGDDGKALVQVNLPGTEPAPELVSDLVMINGQRLTRKLNGTTLVSSPGTDSGSIDYTFAITREDVSKFADAKEWQLKVAGTTTTISLRGSSKAIKAARTAQKDGVVHQPVDWSARCSRMAAHPWDRASGFGTGLDPEEIDLPQAQAVCLRAVSRDNSDTVSLYHYGRVLRILGNPDALAYLQAAARTHGHGMARFELSQIFRAGQLTGQDIARADTLLQEAAQAGAVPARHAQAIALLETKQNADLARSLLEDAAIRGHGPSQLRLGRELLTGAFSEAPSAFPQALRFLDSAVDAGNAQAARLLADTFREGLGDTIAPDPDDYLDYLKKAARLGDEAAQDALQWQAQ